MPHAGVRTLVVEHGSTSTPKVCMEVGIAGNGRAVVLVEPDRSSYPHERGGVSIDRTDRHLRRTTEILDAVRPRERFHRSN